MAIIGLFMALAVFSEKRLCYLLFTNDEHLIEIGMEMLYAIVPYFFTYTFAEILSGAMQGAGKTIIPTITTVFCICGLRAIWLDFVPAGLKSISGIVMCYPITWIVTSITLIIYYFCGKVFPD